MVDATLKLGYWQVVHFEGQASTGIQSESSASKVAEILTVTFVLVVIRNQGRTVANAIAVSANAVAVEGVLPSATDNAVARRRARARLA